MKFATVLTATLASYALTSPIVVTPSVAKTLSARGLPAEFTPHIGVTIPSGSKKIPRALSDRIRRVSGDQDSVLKLMDFVVGRVRAECDDINTSIKAVKFEGLRDEAVAITVRTMNNIRTLLSKTVSNLDTTPDMTLTQEERRKLVDDVYTITNELFSTTQDYVETLGGAAGGRSLSRTAHMLTDVLDSITTIDKEVASELSRKLTPIFSGITGRDEDDLLNVIVSPVTSFLSSIKLDEAPATTCSQDCSRNQNEDLK
ncbi:hypothetical protein FLONG3_10336 [Fusarium longipes]|uniref:Uncharacterized protein n=1 Tax=Fusarium longipes TaxID=694270 RepID=A0A395RQQ9_9HYPO|nr:hypothetical protein FLONG3_10336 [Fusarium longipes]